MASRFMSASAVALMVVVLLSSVVSPADALTFDLTPGTKLCFTDELSTLYRVQLFWKPANPEYTSFLTVTLTQPDGVVVYEQRPTTVAVNPKGYFFDWTPLVSGEFGLCFVSAMKSSTGTYYQKTIANNYGGEKPKSTEINFHWLPDYEIEQQQHQDLHATTSAHHPTAKGSPSVPKNTRNRPLMNQARYIESGLRSLIGEFEFYTQREREQRDTNESTNARALWITVIGLVVVGAVTGLQHLAMKKHLRSKKILD